METLWQDLRYGFRMLLRGPGFTAVAVISMALGTGLNSALFSLINAALLKPLPVKESGRLVALYQVIPHVNLLPEFNYPYYVDLRDQNEVFSELAAYCYRRISLSHSGETEPIQGALVSGNYFSMLGVGAVLGRPILSEDDRTPGAHPVAVISYDLWTRRFGKDPDVIGKDLVFNSQRFTVIGVAPEKFTGTVVGSSPDVWVPTMMQPYMELPARIHRKAFGTDLLHQPGWSWVSLIGRLKPGITRTQAQAGIDALSRRLASYSVQNKDTAVKLVPLNAARIPLRLQDVTARFLKFLVAMTGLVLLVACANVANLLLQRGVVRQKEISIRLALGASRARLVRQLLTESVWLALLGGAAGLLVALWTNYLLLALRPPTLIPLALDLNIDNRVLGFTTLLSVFTGILFGLAPALVASRPDLIPALKGVSQTFGRAFRGPRPSNLLVSFQIALSLVLLICAGLFLRSLRAEQAIDPGFDPRNLIMVTVDLEHHSDAEASSTRFYQQLVERVEALPGVQSVSLVNWPPLSAGGEMSSSWYIPRPPNVTYIEYSIVGPHYFRTMSIPLVAGRDFGPEDRAGAAPVIIINERLARMDWPDENPVGKHYGDRQVIGVVKDTKYGRLGESAAPQQYLPFLQRYESRMTVLVRSAVDPQAMLAAVRRVVQDLDRDVPVFNARTMTEHIDVSLWPLKVAVKLSGLFGLVAVVLAAVGIYGVTSYSVTQRTQEFGIRISLGARPQDIFNLVMRLGLKLLASGLAAGLLLASALTRLLSSFLYGVPATDLLTYLSVATLLAVAMLLASVIPARRATKVEPMIALRYE